MPPRRPSARANVTSLPAGAALEGRSLRIGGRRLPLWSGAIHYWRLERTAWRRALEELRSIGFEMIETYVPWGVHEVEPGRYDFGEHDERKDLSAFLELARELGLAVFLRPGPHINAELTYFGLPERIVHTRAMQARSPRQNPVYQAWPPRMFPVPSYASHAYHDAVGTWFDAVGAVAKPFLAPSGPVALLQVDNEASYYFRDGPYDQDYHPDACALFRSLLVDRYGSLAAVEHAHRRRYPTIDDIEPPTSFRASRPEELVLHLDWARFREELITHALERMKHRLEQAGFRDIPTVHNLPLGDGGLPLSVPALGRVVDVVGLDYYHARREHRTIKRRTLSLAGTVAFPYAPELGVGAPPWFTPLAHEDSLYTALVALAYGLRGFNLYMAVDRDRWYGAPIDHHGMPRVEAGAWKHLVHRLKALRFHELERHADVALVLPTEYGRLTRATHLLGPMSPSILEALGGTPVDACREDALGFVGPIQLLWWKWLARFADALTNAGVPYVYVDGDAPEARWGRYRAMLSPSFEFATPARWKKLAAFARNGGKVIFGPAMPHLDDAMHPHPFEVPADSERVQIDTAEDASRVITELVAELDLARPFRVTAPVESAVHSDGRDPRVLFVMNPTREARATEVRLPTPTALRDLFTDERLDGDRHVELTLAPRSVRCFELEPHVRREAGEGRIARARARRGSA